MPTIKHILFPLDFSAAGTAAIPYVRALANQLHAKVTVLSVVPPAWVTPPGLIPPPVRLGPGGAAERTASALGRAGDRRPGIAARAS